MFTVVASGVELAPVAAPPPDTLAVFDTLGTATTPTLTVSAIMLVPPPPLIGVVLVQVTIWPEAEQVQPVPVPTMNVRPIGRVSVTVIVPQVAGVPLLVTVRV